MRRGQKSIVSKFSQKKSIVAENRTLMLRIAEKLISDSEKVVGHLVKVLLTLRVPLSLTSDIGRGTL